MKRLPIKVDNEELSRFCRRHHIRRLALFGSILREDFRPDSDVDLLVEFEPGHVPGLIRLAGLELDLSKILGGREVEINTPLCLSQHFRAQVLEEAEALYIQER